MDKVETSSSSSSSSAKSRSQAHAPQQQQQQHPTPIQSHDTQQPVPVTVPDAGNKRPASMAFGYNQDQTNPTQVLSSPPTLALLQSLPQGQAQAQALNGYSSGSDNSGEDVPLTPLNRQGKNLSEKKIRRLEKNRFVKTEVGCLFDEQS